jgi:redox-sensing transcriptional repressor
MRYLRFLTEWTAKGETPTVTSAQIAEALDIDPTQVRKDFSTIGLLGIGRVGFDACEACGAIRMALGFDQKYDAVLVGAGHLGTALLAYSGFTRYGLNIVAAFDRDKSRVGREIAGCPVKPTRTLKPFIRRHGIRLAVLTTPVEVAQELTDRLVSAGVVAIWNFTPSHLRVPEGVLVRNEHISLGLSEIAHHLRRLREAEESAGPSQDALGEPPQEMLDELDDDLDDDPADELPPLRGDGPTRSARSSDGEAASHGDGPAAARRYAGPDGLRAAAGND